MSGRFDTLLAHAGTPFRQLGVVVGVTSHESGVQRRYGCEVTRELSTLFRLLVAGPFFGTSLILFSGFVAVLEALVFYVAQMVDSGDSASTGHYTPS